MIQIDQLLAEAVKRGASDLHLLTDSPPVLRIDGQITPMDESELSQPELRQALYSLMTPYQVTRFEEELELCFAYTVHNVGYFRVSVYYQQGNVEGAIRIGFNQIRSLPELGLPPVVEELARLPHGLVLVTGATGMGKTTTMNTLIDQINRERRAKIITIEDPIEYLHDNKRSLVVQQEVYSDTKSFGQALVHALRQDPDVICVGEMRDLETIQTALTAAETGHLVLATLHTATATGTIGRIVDVFPADQQRQIRVMLASTLQAVLAQVLLPRLDRPGRVLAYELLLANTGVRNLIREDKNEAMVYSVMQTQLDQGMETLDRVLKRLFDAGIIGYDSALSFARDPKYVCPKVPDGPTFSKSGS